MSILRNVRNNKRCSVVTVVLQNKASIVGNSVVSSKYVTSLDIYMLSFVLLYLHCILCLFFSLFHQKVVACIS